MTRLGRKLIGWRQRLACARAPNAPPLRTAAPSAPAQTSVAATPNSARHVLVVDNDALTRRILTLFLKRAGYTVSAMNCAAEALEVLDEGLRPDLVITDHAMPGLSGAELLWSVQARLPGLRGLLITGYDEAAVREALPPGALFLLKPFLRAEFIAKIGALFVRSAPSAPRAAA